MRGKYLSIGFLFFLLSSCLPDRSIEELPILGPYERVNGQKKIYPVRAFRLYNQNGEQVTEKTFSDQLRVVDFFFTSCPSICPKVQRQMLRIGEAFRREKKLTLISHTIDPKRDTVAALAHYAYNLGVSDASRWQFLTGEHELLYELADDHFNIVVEDNSVPGGFDHTGRIVLIDRDGYIRSFANGLNPASVDTLMEDIRLLIQNS